MSRWGTRILVAGGLGLVLFMAYTLTLGRTRRVPRLSSSVSSVASVVVFFPERTDWLDFRDGIESCRQRGLARVVEETDSSVLLETPRQHSRLRFSWQGARGVRTTQEELTRLLASAQRPLAVVGSSNTMLTVAVAEVLDRDRRLGRESPVLLLPWASSVMAKVPGRGQRPIPLLDIDPGRTFRFCADNQSAADLVIRCLVEHEPRRLPERAYLVVDRNDPYSVDLAECFRRAIAAAAPRAEIVEQPEVITRVMPGLLPEPPGPGDGQWADAIWRSTEAGEKVDHPTWVVLPLQAEPARRLIAALRRRNWRQNEKGEGSVRVVCGDGVGLDTLSELVGQGSLPVWCFSSASAPKPERTGGSVVSLDAQVPAEIVSAIVRILDQSQAAPVDLQAGLARLDLGPNDPAAFGREIAFDSSGERRAAVLGHVLAVRPGRTAVLGYAADDDGHWSAAVPIEPVPVAARR